MPERWIALVLLGLWGCGGCVAGSLATSTGPRGGGQWSIARKQQVHVDETVKFSFVLREILRPEPINAIGQADYCVFDIGGEKLPVAVNADGVFRTEYTFDQVTPGLRIPVRATAYRLVGQRDGVKVAGQWIRRQSPYDEPDIFVATDAIELTSYRSRIELTLPGDVKYDFDTATLAMEAEEGTTVRYPDKPLRPGFQLHRADDDAGWIVVYEPAPDEIRHSDVTRVTFSVYDRSGDKHARTLDLATP